MCQVRACVWHVPAICVRIFSAARDDEHYLKHVILSKGDMANTKREKPLFPQHHHSFLNRERRRKLTVRLGYFGSSVKGKSASAFVSYSLSRRGLLVLIPVVFICILVSARYTSVQAGSFQNIVSSATSAFRTSCSVQPYDDQSTLSLSSSKNFTDLIFGDRNVYYGTIPFPFLFR